MWIASKYGIQSILYGISRTTRSKMNCYRRHQNQSSYDGVRSITEIGNDEFSHLYWSCFRSTCIALWTRTRASCARSSTIGYCFLIWFFFVKTASIQFRCDVSVHINWLKWIQVSSCDSFCFYFSIGNVDVSLFVAHSHTLWTWCHSIARCQLPCWGLWQGSDSVCGCRRVRDNEIIS